MVLTIQSLVSLGFVFLTIAINGIDGTNSTTTCGYFYILGKRFIEIKCTTSDDKGSLPVLEHCSPSNTCGTIASPFVQRNVTCQHNGGVCCEQGSVLKDNYDSFIKQCEDLGGGMDANIIHIDNNNKETNDTSNDVETLN